MITFYFKLQFKRFYRKLNELGLNIYFAIPLLVVVFNYFSTLFFNKLHSKAPLIYSFIAVYFIIILNNEARQQFLKKLFSKYNFLKVRLFENIGVAMPFVIFLVSQKAFIYALSVFLISIFTSFLSGFKTFHFVIPTPFYKNPFEFIVGFRRFFWVFLITYALTIIAVQVKNFNLGVFSLCVVCFITTHFYERREPKEFVWVYNKNAKEFLKHKILTAIKYVVLLSLPIHILLWIAFPKEFYITIIFQLIGFVFLVTTIFAKYKYYSKPILITTNFLIGLCLIFPPLFVVVTPSLYNDAIKNLNQLL